MKFFAIKGLKFEMNIRQDFISLFTCVDKARNKAKSSEEVFY